MPGLFGIVGRAETSGLRDVADAMRTRMLHHRWYRTDTHVDESSGLALGRVSLGFVKAAPQPVWSADRKVCLVMEGELYGKVEPRNSAVNHEKPVGSASDAVSLLDGYLREGRGFFARTNGFFAAAIWDGRTDELVLTNDRFGMKPLYFAHIRQKLVFASEIKSILADFDVPRDPDLRGIAQFFSFGQNFGEDTLYSSIRIVPAAAWVVYNRLRDNLCVDQYWKISDTAPSPISTRAEFYDRIDTAFARAVQNRTADSSALGISLSGGLDSRTILALVRPDVSVKCVSMGMLGSLDHDCASRLSQFANREHHCCLLDDRFLANFEQHMRHMVHLTDGHYLDQCIVIPTLPKYRELGINVLLRGHAGELMHMDKAYNFSLDRDGWAIRNDNSLRSWLRSHLTGYILGNLPGPLFRVMSQSDVQAIAGESIDNALLDSHGSDVALHQVWRLFLSQRLRRETAMSMAKIGTLMEIRLPFLDNEVVATLLAAPPQWKRGDAIQLHILRKHCPEFLSVINANTGTFLGAGSLRRKLATFRMKVLAKLGVPGYQPYERLGLWLRRELRSFVSRILLDDRTLDRGVFKPETVSQVVEGHMESRQNHTALLLSMLIFELGQREFVDGDEFAPSYEPTFAAN